MIIKGYEDICKKISAQEKSFKVYLEQFILDKDCIETLDFLSKQTDVYIFSGIIRNFLTGDALYNRDIDIVLGKLDKHNQVPVQFLKDSTYTKNSFGGFKIIHGNKEIDAWLLENTWGIRNKNEEPSAKSLINSAFFNFSAITYDYKNEIFIFDKDFAKFYQNREMDYVYGENPNIPLCIVNCLHYKDLYGFNISTHLKEWIIKNYTVFTDYEGPQIKHFKEVKYSNIKILHTVNSLYHV